MSDSMDWVDKREEEVKNNSGYLDIKEGDNRFVLLSHLSQFAQVFEGGKYRAAQEGDTNVSIRGVGWVWQDGKIKEAKLPYKVVAAIRAIQQNPDWEFKLPFPHVLTLTAIGAGTKEVKYSVTPSPKETAISALILEELNKKPTPEELVEKLKGKSTEVPLPDSDIQPDEIPF